MPAWMLSVVAWLLVGVGFLGVVAVCLWASMALVEFIVRRAGLWADLVEALFVIWKRKGKTRR